MADELTKWLIVSQVFFWIGLCYRDGVRLMTRFTRHLAKRLVTRWRAGRRVPPLTSPRDVPPYHF